MARFLPVVVALLGTCGVALAEAPYSIAPLAYPPGSFGTPSLIIGNTQTVVVTSKTGAPYGQDVPFLLSTSAAVAFPTSPGNTVFWPQAINGAGAMAGLLAPDAANPVLGNIPPFSAALYRDGQYILLAPPSGSVTDYVLANGINNLGAVVGWDAETNGHKGAVLWTNGEASWIDPNADEASSAQAINDKGWIAGATGPASLAYARPVVWHDGDATYLPLPPDATSGTALAINNAGQVLVTYTGAGLGNRLLIWEDGAETILPSLPDGDFTAADSLNAAGAVVGTSGSRAVYWYDGQMDDLNDLIAPDSGWILTDAASIDDAGDIVGYGTYNGIDTPFLLTPISTGAAPALAPEPATLALLSLAALPLLARRRQPAHL